MELPVWNLPWWLHITGSSTICPEIVPYRSRRQRTGDIDTVKYHVMLFRWPCTVGQPSFTSGESPPITALSRGTFYRLPPPPHVQQLRAYSSPKWYMTLNSDRFSQKSPAFNVWQQANLLKNDSTATRFLWYFVLGKYLTTSLLQLCTSECFCGLWARCDPSPPSP